MSKVGEECGGWQGETVVKFEDRANKVVRQL